MSMRIDFVITGLDIGGAEFQVVALAETLARRGHVVRVISLLQPAAFVERLERAGIPVHSLGMRRGLDLPFALARLYRLCRQSPPDILHGHMVHANLLARLTRLLLPGLKVITTAHALNEGGRFRDWAYRLTTPLSCLNTTVSAAATRRFTAEKVFPADRTRTVYNGIDTGRFHPAAERSDAGRDFTWLAVGRLTEQKDYSTLLQAFALVGSGRLLIAGKGPLSDRLQAQSQRLGLTERVVFLGVRTDIAELYRRADAFVLSSAQEGYGLVAAEAMASGLPVVVTDSGGPGEILGKQGEAGLLVPARDPAALAAAMIRLAAMPAEVRSGMGHAGRERVEAHFSLQAIASQWEDLYGEIMRR
jgi:glycosyltransferase involved in cell wall biosynthesis